MDSVLSALYPSPSGRAESVVIRWLGQHLLHSLLRKKAAEAGAAWQQQSTSSDEPISEAIEPERYDLAMVAAEVQIVASLVDQLQHRVTTNAAGFTCRTGMLGEKSVAVVTLEDDAAEAGRAAQAAIDAYKPRLMLALGTAIGVSSAVQPGDLIVANRVVSTSGDSLSIAVSAAPQPRQHVGTVVTTAVLPTTRDQCAELATRHDALAVDRIGFAVANTCRRESTPMMAAYVVVPIEGDLPQEVQHLHQQSTLAGRAGAFLGGVVRRPAYARDLWKLKQSRWEVSDRLADFVSNLQLSAR